MSFIHPRTAVIVHDLFMTWAAWLISYTIRYSIWPESPELTWMNYELLFVIGVQGIIAYFFNLYHGLWRFASVPDLINISKSAVVGTLIIGFSLFLINRADGVSRTVLILYPLLLIVFWGVPRLAYRVIKDSKLNLVKKDRKIVLLYGAGQSADMFIRHANASEIYHIIGIVDDRPQYKGSNLRGVKVLGNMESIPKLCDKYNVEVIVVTMEAISANQMKLLVDKSMSTQAKLLTLPDLDNVSNFELSHLSPVTIDDLLGREKITTDWSNVIKSIKGKSVMITGGGGSIGSELARQLSKFELKSLTILDHSEHNLYQIDRELTDIDPDLLLRSLLVNVTDMAHLFQVFNQVKPDIVFHAAAYKHVPLLEKMPCEGFINNVLGTKNIADTCDQFNVESMVLISTDKAVNPYSVMGATKRIAETYCQFKNQKTQTDYIIVRFGNVLASAGSVVPLFNEQIAKGGPVTVTHKEMTRYFMTIEEACQLIVQSMVIGIDGDIHVLDMGQPVSILSLAKRMITLSGKVPNKDIEIRITGLRQGEKLHEQLYYDVEQLNNTNHKKIFSISSDVKSFNNYEKRLSIAVNSAINFDEKGLLNAIKKLVPEFIQQEPITIISNRKSK